MTWCWGQEDARVENQHSMYPNLSETAKNGCLNLGTIHYVFTVNHFTKYRCGCPNTDLVHRVPSLGVL